MNFDEYARQHPGAQRINLPVAFCDSSGEVVAAIEEGGAETARSHKVATLYLPLGDIIGFRNAQSGEVTGTAGSLNFDYGAGSADDRGIVSRNYDIGAGAKHFDGRKRLMYQERGYDDPAKNFAEYLAPLRVRHLLVPRASGLDLSKPSNWRRAAV